MLDPSPNAARFLFYTWKRVGWPWKRAACLYCGHKAAGGRLKDAAGCSSHSGRWPMGSVLARPSLQVFASSPMSRDWPSYDLRALCQVIEEPGQVLFSNASPNSLIAHVYS